MWSLTSYCVNDVQRPISLLYRLLMIEEDSEQLHRQSEFRCILFRSELTPNMMISNSHVLSHSTVQHTFMWDFLFFRSFRR
jgi:hypothetical protein